jgi:hypothetical protein
VTDTSFSVNRSPGRGQFRNPRCDDEGNICVVPPSSGQPFRFFFTSGGDGTGNKNLNGNYITPTDFFYEANTRFEIYQFLITVSDNASFNQLDYGGIVGGLINGISFLLEFSFGGEVPILTAEPIKYNYEWYEVATDVKLTTFAGLSQTLQVIVDLPRSFGRPLTLDPGDKVIVRLNDNFTGLVSHTFRLHGTKF